MASADVDPNADSADGCNDGNNGCDGGTDGSVPALAERVDELIASVDLRSVSPDGLRELVVQTERSAQALLALQAQVMTRMVEQARRHATRSERLMYGDGAPEEFVTDEVAALLSSTKATANAKLQTAWHASRFESLGEAWRSGRIDAAKVRLIAEGVAPLTAQHSDIPQLVDDAAIEALVGAAIAYATSHTTGQVRPWLARRVLAIDPGAAEVRRKRAMADRRVVITPGADGMSELWALLPWVHAQQIQQSLNALAHQAPASDPRNADQRRADALYEVICEGAATPQIALSLMITGRGGRNGGIAELDPIGELAGVGPVTIQQVAELIANTAGSPGVGEAGSADIRGRIVPCDPATGYVSMPVLIESSYRPSVDLDGRVRARDLTCRFPGCRRSAVGSANGVDVDHTVEWPVGQTTPGNLACLCRRHHRLKHSSTWKVEHLVDGAMVWIGPTGRRYTTTPWRYTDPPPT